jgi:choline dehydrogenase
LRNSPNPCLEQWEENPNGNRGTYATNGIAVAIVKKSSVKSGDPDIFVTGAPAYISGYFPGYSTAALEDARHWTWITLKAHSRNNVGTVSLQSADPRDMPLINFNSFDTGIRVDKDLEAVYEGMEFSRNIFSDLIPLSGGFEDVWPCPSVQDDELKEFIKNEAWGHHACCTSPISASDNPMAVLDSSFRVRGVDGLRVVDASIFPKIPRFYIAVPIYMISEKASDIILADAV